MIEKALLILIVASFLIGVFRLRNLISVLRIFKFKIIYAFVVPILLFSMWVYFSTKEVYRIDNVILRLTSEYSQRNLDNPVFTELTQGEKIQGKFTAQENYLGIVAVRFWNFFRLNDDDVTFRLREQGQNDWYYQNKYKVDQFQPHGFFTFGFPVIPESTGKTYVFEVESTRGFPGNAVGLSPVEPAFVVHFKYPRDLVTSSLPNLFNFFTRKFVELLHNYKFIASSFIYFLPLIIYILYFNSNIGKTIKRSFVRLFVQNLEVKIKKIDQEIDKQIFVLSHNLNSLILRLKILINKSYKLIIWFCIILVNILKDEQSSRQVSQLLIYLAIVLDIFWIRHNDTTVILLISLWVVLIKIYNVSIKTTYLSALPLFLLSFITWYVGDMNLQFSSERSLAWSFLFVNIATFQMVIKLNKK